MEDTIFQLHMDHDHKTSQNRGLLCGNCNRGLGLFRDEPLLLTSAIAYMDKYDKEDING